MKLFCGTKQYFINPYNDDRVYFISDYVHLIKRLRNNLYKR